jgi:hypothetical protein
MTIEDHEAIRNLMARSCHHADAAETEAYVALYTPDGSLDLGLGAGPMRGHDALRAFAERRTPGASLHLSVNPIIEVDGDRATAASYVVVLGGNDDPAVRLAGRYVDELHKIDGAWLFASRVLTPNFVKRG